MAFLLRLQQAIAVGAEVVAMACPYCMLVSKDGQLAMEKGETIEIEDIVELVVEAL